MTWKSASLLTLTLTLGCGTSTTPNATQSAPAPGPPPGVTPISAEESARHRSATLVNDNQATNDRIAKQVTDAIAGHEKEPAEQVFKNIQSLKGMPAGRLVRVMNMGFIRALGVSCLHCHYGPDYSSDEKRQKLAARDMMAMTKMINDRLQSLQNLEGKPEERVVNCSTCHRGHVDPTAGM